MKPVLVLIALCVLVRTTGSTAIQAATDQSGSPAAAARQTQPPETVWVVFHVKRGQEGSVKTLLAESWATYVRKDMVFRQPHILAQGSEKGGEYFLELLSWKNSDIPDNADAEVRALWKSLEAKCEPRGGDPGIVFREVELVAATTTNNIRIPSGAATCHQRRPTLDGIKSVEQGRP